MSIVTCFWFSFALQRSLIGLKNSRHFLNQSDAKLKFGRTRFPALGAGYMYMYFLRVLIGSLCWLVCCDWPDFYYTQL